VLPVAGAVVESAEGFVDESAEGGVVGVSGDSTGVD
jgi:hypothetical protein